MAPSPQSTARQLAAAILDRAPDPVVAFDRRWRYTYANRRATELLRKAPGDMIGKSIWEVFPPHGAGRKFKESCERAWRDGRPVTIERYSKRVGAWVENYICPFEDWAFSEWREVTERRKAARELLATQARLARTQDFSLVMSLHLSLDGKWLKVPPSFVRFLGYDSEAELQRKSLSDISYPDDYQVASRQLERLRRGEIKSFELETRLIRKDGSITWVYVNWSIVTDERGKPLYFLTYLRDINEQKKGEEELRRLKDRESARAAEMQAVMEAVPVAILIARDPECRQVLGNRLAYEMVGAPPGSDLSPSALSESRNRITKDGREIPTSELPIQRAAATGEPVRNYDFEVVLSNGVVYNLLGHAVPLLDDAGHPRGAVGAFMDITERKVHEEHLRQMQKLESIGLLAGGIAHDFNNLLTSIMGTASLMQDEVGPAQAPLLNQIMEGAERAAHLTRQLLAYSGQGQFITRNLNLSQAVTEMADLIQFSIPKSVELGISVRKRLPPVRMDPSQLQQVLMNLVINAGEAIGEGNPGRITVSTFMRDLDESLIDATGREVAPGRYACIEVADTGPGLEADKIGKVFDPFFTTKFTGRGLGLSAVAGIVRSQNGGITVESPPGGGAIFRVLLPAGGRAAQEQRAEANAQTTILVADDEAAIRDFISAVLRKRGYRVLVASDGQETLGVFNREGGSIDAIVLDVVMPAGSADDVLPQILSKRPDLKVLLTSGYSEVGAKRLCSAYPGARFIQKPYTARRISEAIEELLKVEKK